MTAEKEMKAYKEAAISDAMHIVAEEYMAGNEEAIMNFFDGVHAIMDTKSEDWK